MAQNSVGSSSVLSSFEKRELLKQFVHERNQVAASRINTQVKIIQETIRQLHESVEHMLACNAIDSGAIGYLMSSEIPDSVTYQEITDNRPIWLGVQITPWGRIGCMLLPRLPFELYQNQAALIDLTLESIRMCQRAGARVVSLTGLLPSALNYGQALIPKMAQEPDWPVVTNGHATTYAAVVCNIENLLQVAERDLQRETVGILGLGSVGLGTLRLMLRCLPHPAEIILCDVYSKSEYLQCVEREIRDVFGFEGKVRSALSHEDAATGLYNASLIVGATNVPGILDVNRLQPGTLIIDDSVPYCFEEDKAIKRLTQAEDILFSAGGALHMPHASAFSPHDSSDNMMFSSSPLGTIMRISPHHTYSCIISSLLSADFDAVPTMGPVKVDESLQHYQLLKRLGCTASHLHCGSYALPAESIQRFSQRFGHR